MSAFDFAGLLGDTLSSASGPVATTEALAGKEAVALYFSAHWCPPCRGFTPNLVASYTEHLKAKGIEVIFVSSDKDEASFQAYFQEMPWLALPFESREMKETLSQKFEVQGIPTLVVLDGSGNTINANGRAAVMEDPTGGTLLPGSAEAGATAGDRATPTPMQRGATAALMHQERVSGPCTVLCLALCGFWVPLLFWMAAANTLSTCGSEHFQLWLKLYGILPLGSAILMHIIATCWACIGNRTNFKNALRLQGLTTLVQLGMFVWGWVEYAKTTEDLCVGDGDINPRQLALAFLIIGSIMAPCYPCVVCVALKQIQNPTESAAAEVSEVSV